jgi:hypothetical protein
MPLYSSPKKLEIKNPCLKCPHSVSYGCDVGEYCHAAIIVSAKNELMSQLTEVKEDWIDRPTSEGWWWYSRAGELFCLKLIEDRPGVYYHITDEKHHWFVADYLGKWCRAVVPSVEREAKS